MSSGFSWGLECWNNLSYVEDYSDKEVKLIENAKNYFEEFGNICRDFGSKQKKLSDSYGSVRPVVIATPFVGIQQRSSTTHQNFMEIYKIADQMGDAWDQFGQHLRSQSCKKLKDLFKLQSEQLKKHKHERSKLQNAYMKEENLLDNLRSRYIGLHRDVINSYDQFQRLSQNVTIQRKEIAKAEQNYINKKNEFERVRQDYAAKLNYFNDYNVKYHYKDMPDLISELEGMDRDRVANYRLILDDIHLIFIRTVSRISDLVETCKLKAEAMNADQNSDELIASLKSLDQILPGELEFLNLDGKSQLNLSSENISKQNVTMPTNRAQYDSRLLLYHKHLEPRINDVGPIEQLSKTYEPDSRDFAACQAKITNHQRQANSLRAAILGLEKLGPFTNTSSALSNQQPQSQQPSRPANRPPPSAANKQQHQQRSVDSSASNSDWSEEEGGGGGGDHPPPAVVQMDSGDIPPPPPPMQFGLAAGSHSAPIIAGKPSQKKDADFQGYCVVNCDFSPEQESSGGHTFLSIRQAEEYYVVSQAEGWTSVITFDKSRAGLVPSSYLTFHLY